MARNRSQSRQELQSSTDELGVPPPQTDSPSASFLNPVPPLEAFNPDESPEHPPTNPLEDLRRRCESIPALFFMESLVKLSIDPAETVRDLWQRAWYVGGMDNPPPEQPQVTDVDSARRAAALLLAWIDRRSTPQPTVPAETPGLPQPVSIPPPMPPEESLRWVSLAEAERITSINRGTISRAIKAGELASNGQRGKGKLKVDAAALVHWTAERAKGSERRESDAQVRRLLEKHK